MEGHSQLGQAVLLSLAGLRDLLDSDLHPLDSEQFDFWRGSVHRDWSWLCDHTDLLQHSLFAFRWPKHLHGNENLDHATLCYVDTVDALPHLLLDFHSLPLHRAVLVQSASIRLFGLHH